VRRALISVFDKTGLDEFAAGLSELGVELVASGGTAAYISELGLSVTPVDELTDVPEMLGGRVKTLHPRIHAAILARRDVEEDADALAEYEIEPFDLVCVNLYPFAQVAARKDVREEEAVEMIDVGGPAMLRAAAKNFVHVAPVCLLARYGPVLEELRLDGDLSAQTRRELAAEAS
jgi:phosphoribosylaminoimidazolecarboxamide formyltransferase / IMP cyclohydrolase